MTAQKFRVFAIGIALLAGACAHVETPRYYTLDMTPSNTAKATCNVSIERLRPSDALTRNDILIKKSPTEVEYYALDRWVSGLGELVSEKLGIEFGAARADLETVVVSGQITAFEQVDTPDGAQAHARLALEVRSEKDGRYGEPLLKKTYDVSLKTEGAGPSPTVHALSRALEQIAASLASDINGIAANKNDQK